MATTNIRLRTLKVVLQHDISLCYRSPVKHELSSLLDGLDAGILITDKHGRILFANTTFRRLSGCSSGPGLSKTRLHELQALLERVATPIRPGTGLQEFREQERDHILHALRQTGGKIYGSDGAAALLGLPPTTLVSRLRKYGLEPKRRRRIIAPPAPAFSEEPEPVMLD